MDSELREERYREDMLLLLLLLLFSLFLTETNKDRAGYFDFNVIRKPSSFEKSLRTK